MNNHRGGQFWKNSSKLPEQSPWHHHWRTYLRLEEKAAGFKNFLSTQVTRIQYDGQLFTLHLNGPRQTPSTITAKKVLYCPGTFDRQVPINGWTTPGVLSAGGIQAFVKENGTAPGTTFVVGGAGPFLLAAAATIIQAGGKVEAIVDASPLSAWFGLGVAGPLSPSKVKEALGYLCVLIRHGVKFHLKSRICNILSNSTGDRVVSVEVQTERKKIQYEADAVGLNWGFTPQLELYLQLGGETAVDRDGSLVAVVDENFETNIPNFYVAGEGTGVDGVLGSLVEGRIAAQSILGLDVDLKTRVDLKRHKVFSRAFQKAVAVPNEAFEALAGDTTFCRCEESTWSDIDGYLRTSGSIDARSVKGSTRAGMGNCQGRMCGFALCLASAAERERRAHSRADVEAAFHEDLRAIGAKPLAAPVSLESLAEDRD
ncbi:Hydrogen cyanide synthase subunit HcnB [Corynebacterium hadale]|nr:Hydrogen cyanide synthase subunit HcnB [Corynebacterium hadale]